MGLNIQLTSGATDAELQAVQALISVLRDCNNQPLHLRNTTEPVVDAAPQHALAPVATVMPGELVSSTVSGPDLPPSISVTAPPAPVPVLEVPLVPVSVVEVPLPPAPPVPPAPVAVVPPPPVTSGAAVALDAEGLPWDARIHSSNRQQVANGTWRRRKNTPDETWEAVRAELRQVMAAPAAPIAPTPLETYIVEQPVIDAATAFAVPVPPTPPVAAPAPPVATASATPDVTAVTDLLVRITGAQAAGTVTVEQVQAAVTFCGLTSLRDLMNRPDLVPTISAAVFGAGQ